MFKKRLLCVGLSAVLAAGLLAGCGGQSQEGTDKAQGENAPLKIWVGLNQGEFYRELVKEFEQANNVNVEVVEVENPNEDLLKDTEAAADVLRIPHDQLGQLVEAGTVYPNEKYGEAVLSENCDLAQAGATYNGTVYGYPASAECMFLYYDKSVYTEDDVKTMDGLTSKGKVGLNLSEEGADYRITPWFISNGAYLFGENGDDVSGSTFNNAQGLNVLKWVASAKNNPGIVSVNTEEISALQEGKINALFSGVWNAKNVQEVLGDNMGTAVYPTIDFGDGVVNLKAFSGVSIFVVNVSSKNPAQAMDLARFVTTEEAQLAAAEALNTVPSNANARAAMENSDNQIARTVIEATTAEHSVLMPNIPQMKNFWPHMNALLVDTYNGNVPEADMQAKLDKLVEDISEETA